MINDEQNLEYLRQHLPYELLMLRHTLFRIQTNPYGSDWMAFFEAFFLHARNLYQFLTNDDKKGNLKACDYIKNFRAKKTDQTKSTYSRLNPQLLHLGNQRTSSSIKKLKVEDAEKFSQWLEIEFERFTNSLDDRYRLCWKKAYFVAATAPEIIDASRESWSTTSVHISSTEIPR